LLFFEQPLALLLDPLALRDVVPTGVDQLAARSRDRIPEDPFDRAVLAHIPVLEGVRRLTGEHELESLNRPLAVLGVDEVQKRSREHLLGRKAESALPRRVHVLEISVRTGDPDEVARDREEPALVVLGVLTLEHSSELRADLIHDLEKFLVRRLEAL
jgi:hypothetical protein